MATRETVRWISVSQTGTGFSLDRDFHRDLVFLKVLLLQQLICYLLVVLSHNTRAENTNTKSSGLQNVTQKDFSSRSHLQKLPSPPFGPTLLWTCSLLLPYYISTFKTQNKLVIEKLRLHLTDTWFSSLKSIRCLLECSSVLSRRNMQRSAWTMPGQ